MEIAILSTMIYHLMAKYAGVELLLVITTVNFKSLNVPIIRQWFAKWNSLGNTGHTANFCMNMFIIIQPETENSSWILCFHLFTSVMKAKIRLPHKKGSPMLPNAGCIMDLIISLIVYLHAGVCITLVIVTEKYSFTMQHRRGNKIMIGVVRTQRRQLSSSSDFHITSSQAHSAHQNRKEGECLQSLFLHLIRLFSTAKFIRSVADTRRG